MDAVTKSQIKNAEKSIVYIGTTGGNNAGFGNIAKACIYKPSNEAPWGPDYEDDNDTDRKGWCRKNLFSAREYIAHGLGEDFTRAVDQMEEYLKNSKRDVPKANVYFSSYVEFWNDTTDECDKWSFGRWFSTGYPKLVKALRAEMNDLVRKFNAVQEEVIKKKQTDVGTSELVAFHHIPISEEFAGHRFCEKDHTFEDQWTSAEVWIWNLQWKNGELSTDVEENMEGLKRGNDTFGWFMDAPAGVAESDSRTILDIDTLEFDAAGGSQSGFGWTARPFHPKPRGYNKMKEVFINKLRSDGIPGVKVEAPAPDPQPQPQPQPQPEPTKQLTIMLENKIDLISNENFWAFYQTDRGITPNGCDEKYKPVIEVGASNTNAASIDNPPFPQGEWTAKLYDQDCKYGSDGKGAGTLTCPDHDQIACKEHGDKGGGRDKNQQCIYSDWAYHYHPTVYCEW